MDNSRYSQHNQLLDYIQENAFPTVSSREPVEVLNGEIPLSSKSCFYVYNWKLQRITKHRNLEKILGYSVDELDAKKLVSIYHPDEIEIVSRITKASIKHCSTNPIDPNEYALFMTYRIQKKNGDFIHVLRESGMYQVDKNKRMISNFTYLSDITYLNLYKKVSWHIEAPKLDSKIFKEHVMEAFSDFFSAREKEILEFLKAGHTSAEVAKHLHLSKHTVDTHRRNMLKKSKCRNTVDLLEFSEKHQIN